jgi:AcrR family transcriptional regulator
MTDTVLTRERILEAAEDVLRRFGPAKMTVVDVARALNVSHGSVYRHFPSKAALCDAVLERWLERISTPLDDIVRERAPALPRLRRWFDRLIDSKRQRAQQDHQLFATYMQLAAGARDVVDRHVEVLVGQLARMIDFGNVSGELSAADPTTAARALFEATVYFHHPAHVMERSAAERDGSFDAVWRLLMRGLHAPGRAPMVPRRGLPAHRKADAAAAKADAAAKAAVKA